MCNYLSILSSGHLSLGMLLRLPCMKSTLFFHRLCQLFESFWVTWIATGKVTRNSKSQTPLKMLECFPSFLQNLLLFIVFSHHKVKKEKFWKAESVFFIFKNSEGSFLCNSKIPLWDTGLLQRLRVCLGQTWSDCAWLAKPSNSYEHKQIILLH